MNSWKLNGIAGHHFRQAVCKSLDITFTEIYRTIKFIDKDGIIQTKDGKKYQLKLEEIFEDWEKD